MRKSNSHSVGERIGFYWLVLLPLVLAIVWANRATAKLESVWTDDSSRGPAPLLGVVSPGGNHVS